ncbi:hypothetical protein GC387_13070 [Pseudomonas sp. MWU12-2323]|nr:hypothetical protein [Pseudomonas sp. MWU12-2323]
MAWCCSADSGLSIVDTPLAPVPVGAALVGAELAREEAIEIAKSFAGKLRSHKVCVQLSSK